MKRSYILPQTEAQHITAGQLICSSPNPSIEKGGNLNGNDITPGGIYC